MTPEAEFRIGDKATAMDGSNIGNYVNTWSPFMSAYVGTTVTIARPILFDHGRIGYKVLENGFIWDERGLKLVEDKIYIWRSGKEVHAKYSNKSLEGIAKCSPEDTFDFMTGAKLALERLDTLEKNESKPLQIDDYVKITNTGYLHITCNGWIEEHIINPEWKLMYAYGNALGYPNIKTSAGPYRILFIAENLAYIQQWAFPCACFLIDLDALERVKVD